MSTVNMLEAKTQLSKLVEAVESGREAEIIIARNGKPAARLVPLADPAKGRRRLGLAEGKYDSIDWDEWDRKSQQFAEQMIGEPTFPPDKTKDDAPPA